MVKGRPVSRLGIITLLFACLLWPAMASANGVIRDPLGARVGGRGGVNAAFFDSGMSLHDNPAAMVRIKANHLVEFGFDTIISDVSYSDPQNPRVQGDRDPIPLGNLSVIRNDCAGQYAYGVGIFSPGGFASDYEMQGPFPFLGRQKYKSFGSLARILGGGAVALNDQLSIGGTMGVAVSHAELEGPYSLQTGPLIGTPTLMDVQATGAAFTWSAAIHYQLSECTQIGITYQSENRFDLDGSVRTQIPLIGASRFDTQLAMTWPRATTLGVRHVVTPCNVIGVDVAWYDWSAAFDTIGMRLSNPSSPIYEAIMGSRVNEQLPLFWNDSVTLRLGMETQLSQRSVMRVGYSFMDNPIPSSTLTPYIPTILRQSIGLGFGFDVCGVETDIAYQYWWSDRESVQASDIVGGDFDNSNLDLQVHVLYLGFVKRY